MRRAPPPYTEPDVALALLVRELLIRENVDPLFGDRLAELAKCSGPVFQADCEFFRERHDGNLLLLHLGWQCWWIRR
jgi:hypothetical protein